MQPPFLVQVSALLSNAPGLTTLLSDNANDTYVVVPLACAAFADLMDLEGAEENQPHLEDDSDVYKYPPFPMNWTQQIILGRTPSVCLKVARSGMGFTTPTSCSTIFVYPTKRALMPGMP